MQYRLVKRYLEELTEDQTLVIHSGHPLGLFKSKPDSPRVIITNGLMVGIFDNQEEWKRSAALGVSNYGQMTAGGWMYIGPQGIVHGTYSTLLNAGRLILGLGKDKNLSGKLFVSSGLGGMSGAQGKAIEIAGGVGIIAEVDYSRIETRYNQGWVSKIARTCEESFSIAKEYIAKEQPCAIAYYGNIVDLLKYALDENIHIDLLSDQTSCHAVYDGGYCPEGVTFEERTKLLEEDKDKFISLVNKSLKTHFELIKELHNRGVYFFDYGNSFMASVFDSGCIDISKNKIDKKDGFIFPSYVEDIYNWTDDLKDRLANLEYYAVNKSNSVVVERSNLKLEELINDESSSDKISEFKKIYEFYVIIDYDENGNMSISNSYNANKNEILGKLDELQRDNYEFEISSLEGAKINPIKNMTYIYAVPHNLIFSDHISYIMQNEEYYAYSQASYLFINIAIIFIIFVSLLVPYKEVKDIKIL